MIEFKQKEFTAVVEQLKDFPQVSIERFFKYHGRDLYDKEIINTIPKGESIKKVKKGVYNPAEFKAAIGTADILHPASKKIYPSKSFIFTDSKKKEFDKSFDIVLKVSKKSGLIVAPKDFEYYVFLLYTLSKYNDGNFDYIFVIDRYNDEVYPVISIPRSKEGVENLVKALTEFCVSLKLFIGPYYQVHLVEDDKVETKYFSRYSSFIPTVVSLAYKKYVYPYLYKKIMASWDKSLNYNYSPNLLENLKKHITDNYKDKLIVGDYASCSYYMNFTKGEDAKELRKLFTNPVFLAKNDIDPNRKRCDLDWWAYCAGGYDNDGIPRDLIIMSDLDPVPAIFHETGHFFVNNTNKLGSMQRASHGMVFSDGFVKLSSFLLGLTGGILGSGTPEVISWITSVLLKYPTLQSEFMASYYGLQLMKKMGASEKDVENAKHDLKLAFSTYVLGVFKGADKAAYGRLVGEAGKFIYKNRNK